MCLLVQASGRSRAASYALRHTSISRSESVARPLPCLAVFLSSLDGGVEKINGGISGS